MNCKGYVWSMWSMVYQLSRDSKNTPRHIAPSVISQQDTNPCMTSPGRVNNNLTENKVFFKATQL